MLTGLTDEQVNERIEQGKVNADENPNTRTYKQIVRENTLTFFNFLNLVLLVLVLLVGSYKNAFFVCIIIINTLIGIAQEIRAKKTIDKLAILTAKKSIVIREGKKWTVPTEELVLDDLVCLKTGDQVPADAKVLEGSVEVNESLLTGESDNLPKNVGDELFSGSFVTAGEACCQIIHVGKDNYAAQITSEAKEFKRHNSELKNSLNAILKVISIIIVPLGALLFYKQYYIVGNTFKASVVSMVAGVLGMIPEGLVLLTSVALTLGALVLANKKTLVQELYCIETLARVDTPTWPRSFMPTQQSQRNLIARMKLIPVHKLIKDKSLLMIDDSIVRGTQLRETTEFLYSNGAKEVHIRPACPPLLYGCKYLNFSRSKSEMDLITRRIIAKREGENVDAKVLADYADPDSTNYKEMLEEIRKELNFTTLKYHRLDDLTASIDIEPCKLCTYCWSGKE